MKINIAKGKQNIIRMLFYFAWIIFWYVFYWKICVVDNTGDYFLHNLIPEKMQQGENSLMNFYPLYHLSVLLFMKTIDCTAQVGSAIVLALAATVVLLVSELFCRELLKTQETTEKEKIVLAPLVAAMLVNIVQPIIWIGIAPGYCSGNGYVSPTQAFVKPFALVCCYIMWKCLVHGWTLKREFLLGIALCLSCFAKMMFAVAFILSMGLLILFETWSEKGKNFSYYISVYCQRIIPLIVAGVVLIFQYVWSQKLQGELEVTTQIAFGWMYAWRQVVSNVWLSILFAYLGPIVFLITYFRKLKYVIYWKMTLCYATISFLMVSCMYQSGTFLKHMNFRNAWVITFTLVYIGCFAELIAIKKKHWWIIATFAVHTLFGIALIGKNLFL